MVTDSVDFFSRIPSVEPLAVDRGTPKFSQSEVPDRVRVNQREFSLPFSPAMISYSALT